MKNELKVYRDGVEIDLTKLPEMELKAFAFDAQNELTSKQILMELINQEFTRRREVNVEEKKETNEK